MPIPTALLEYLPKSLLKINDINFLYKYLFDTLQKSSELINKIREFSEKFGSVKTKSLLETFKDLSSQGILDIEKAKNQASFINNAIGNLARFSQLNNSDDDTFLERLLTQIAKVKQINKELSLEKIKERFKSGVYEAVSPRYNVDNVYQDAENNASVVNSLEFTYLLLGENSVRAELKFDGYNQSTINAIVPQIIRNAKLHKSWYKKPLSIYKSKQKSIEKIVPEETALQKRLNQLRKRKQKARYAQQEVLSNFRITNFRR